MVQIDFSKAFDRLQPHIIVEKMENDGFNTNIIKLIASWNIADSTLNTEMVNQMLSTSKLVLHKVLASGLYCG